MFDKVGIQSNLHPKFRLNPNSNLLHCSYLLVIGHRVTSRPDPATGKFPGLRTMPKGKKKWLVQTSTYKALADWAHRAPENLSERDSKMLQCLMAAQETRIPAARSKSQIGLVEQILSIKVMFEAELPYLQFDYLSLHMHSRALFVKLHEKLKQDLKTAKAYQEGQDHVIGCIMMLGSTMHKMLKIRYQDRVVPDHFDPIVEAARVLENFLLEENLGEKESHSSTSEEFSSNVSLVSFKQIELRWSDIYPEEPFFFSNNSLMVPCCIALSISVTYQI